MSLAALARLLGMRDAELRIIESFGAFDPTSTTAQFQALLATYTALLGVVESAERYRTSQR